jgi:hypothetical protein
MTISCWDHDPMTEKIGNPPMDELRLQLSGITKRYPGVVANRRRGLDA